MIHSLVIFLKHVPLMVYAVWGLYVLCLGFGLITELIYKEYYRARLNRFSEEEIKQIINQIVERKIKK